MNTLYRENRSKIQVFIDRFYKYGLYGVFVILVVLFSLLNSNFFSLNNVINLLQQTSSTGIAAAGLVFVLLAGGIDISIASTMFMTSMVAATLTNMGLGLAGAIAVSIACGALVGCINGFLIAKLRLVPLIVTLANLYIIRGVTIAIFGVKTVLFTNEVGGMIARTRLFGFIPFVVITLIIILALVQFVLSHTLYGRQLYAIGNNRQGAETIGIKVTGNIFVSYVVCGAMAGLSGLVSGAQVGGITPTFATGQEFIIISATVLGGVSLFGGRGKAFPGAFLGVLVIMCIENGLVMAKTNMYAYTIVRGIVIFLAVMLDSLRNKGETR